MTVLSPHWDGQVSFGVDQIQHIRSKSRQYLHAMPSPASTLNPCLLTTTERTDEKSNLTTTNVQDSSNLNRRRQAPSIASSGKFFPEDFFN